MIGWKPVLVLLFLFGGAAMTHAQSRDSLRKSLDSTFIHHYTENLIVKLDIENDKDFIKLEQGTYKLDLRPNLGPAKILSISYRWFSFGVEYLPRFLDPIEGTSDRKGKTTGFGIETSFNRRHWVVDVGYRTVSGYYLENTADFVPGFDPSTDPYLTLPDLRTWMIRGAVQYKLNPNYSILAIRTQTEAQRKSAWTIMPGISYNFMTINNDQAVVTSTQKSNTLLVLAQIGVYGTAVLHRNWYLSGGATFGYGGYYTWLRTYYASGDSDFGTITDRVFRGKVHAGLGFNSERFFAGGELIYQKSITEEEGGTISIEYSRLAFQIFMGYRFKAPGFLIKAFDKLEAVPQHHKN